MFVDKKYEICYMFLSKTYNYLIMSKTNFSSLEFFSKHFNVPLEKLKWCILERAVTPEYHRFLVGLSIEGSKLVISVEECCLRRLKRGSLKAHPATLKVNKRKFRIKSEKPIYHGQFMELAFTFRNLADLYCDKWYEEAEVETESAAL